MSTPVQNIGNAALVFASLSSGANPSYPADFPDYPGTGNLCSSGTSLAAASSCMISAEFIPVNGGGVSEQIILTDNALNQANVTQAISVTGTGTNALQTINFPAFAGPVTYGAGPIPLAPTASSGLPVTLSLISGPAVLSGSTLTITGAGNVVVQASQAGNANFQAAATVQRSLTVNRAMLTVSATNASVVYNQPLPQLTYTIAGFVNGDTVASVSGAPTETTNVKAGSSVGTYSILISAGTLKTANYTFVFQNGKLTVTVIGPAATPVFTPGSGVSVGARMVTITDATPGATIYYALHGAIPTTASSKYTGPIQVTATGTVRAIAVATGYSQSLTASATYTIENQAAAPLFSLPAGTYSSIQTVSLASAYALHGVIPTASSTVYAGPITVSASETIRAIAIAPGEVASPVVAATYTIH
jgi:hypothetical protein